MPQQAGVFVVVVGGVARAYSDVFVAWIDVGGIIRTGIFAVVFLK